MKKTTTIVYHTGMAIAMATLFTACSSWHVDRSAGSNASYQSASMRSDFNEPSGAQVSADSSRAQASTDSSSKAGQAANLSNEEEIVLPLYEEQVRVGKRTVDAGQIRLRKVIKTEKVNQPVQLRSETWVIDRVPASEQQGAAKASNAAADNARGSASASAGKPFEQREIVIELKEEQPVVEKQMVHTGNVIARKNAQMKQTTVSNEVRKEDIQLDKSGDTGNVTIKGNLQTATGQINEPAGAQPSQKKLSSPKDASENREQPAEGQNQQSPQQK
jgi:uncharacterized protein (TIGR02271 family)